LNSISYLTNGEARIVIPDQAKALSSGFDFSELPFLGWRYPNNQRFFLENPPEENKDRNSNLMV